MNTEVRYIYLGNMRRDIDRKKREKHFQRNLGFSKEKGSHCSSQVEMRIPKTKNVPSKLRQGNPPTWKCIEGIFIFFPRKCEQMPRGRMCGT